MNGQISSLGWALIIGLILFVVSLNFSLYFAMRKKTEHKSNWLDQVIKTNKTLKNPWQDEDARFEELSNLAETIKQKNTKPPQ